MCALKIEGGMGFKDLKAFNLALLAKQGWRISQDSDSLAHRVLKAKYFSDSNFLEAQLGKNPSYTWRRLVAVRGVFHRGLRWNIGGGKRRYGQTGGSQPLIRSWLLALGHKMPKMS